ncbi:hypothetical protein GCM10022225_50460 [Plantactinospora mayteni]|uniref:Histidine kinase n=1 Tax=Plantactinospora mayteni TaxID=566021 RepID=A0ABQ4EY42_9ACTN|nr:hypothetical protein [Plantactinospora mayteni]GIG99544.1 hypothetical protein Pma05_61170 [Plantactinospora mayteni]
MDITQYVDNLRQQLAIAAEAGGEEARVLAERLTAPLESAVRLTLLDALSAAADEITRDLAPGSVDLRLRGGEPDFVVTPPPVDRPFPAEPGEAAGYPAPTTGGTAGRPPQPDVDEGAVARINFRLPEQLKARIEESAGRERLSVNAWLVRVAAAALEQDDPGRRPARRGGVLGQSYTGWAR